MLKKILVISIFFLSLILFVYSVYKSELIFQGEKRDFYIFYVLISFIGVLLAIFLYYLDKKFSVYFIIISSSFIFSFYLFEFYMTYINMNNLADLNLKKKMKIYKETKNENYDTRNIYEYYLDIKKKESDVKIDPSSANLIKYNLDIFPLTGFSNSNVILCNENGYYKHIRSDRYGFNNNDNIWDEKEIDYVLIGDSLIEGYCQDENDTVQSNLSKQLVNKKIINLGQGGAGSLQEYGIALEYLPDNFKNLIWFICDNDIIDLQKEITNKKLYQYLTMSSPYQNLKNKQSNVNKIFEEIFYIEEKKRKKTEFKRFLKLNYLRTYIHSFFKIKKEQQKVEKFDVSRYEQFYKIMNSIKKLSYDNNFNLYVVYYPTYNYFIENKYVNKDYQNILNVLETLNIDYLDLTKEVFLKEEIPQNLFPFKFYGHYNEIGTKKISISINNFIKRIN